MITFRFYVVSMAALFLALALGVVIGSALDESIVQGLEGQISRVGARADAVAAENDDLRDQLDRDEEALASAAPHMVSGVHEGRVVLVVAERGVDGDDVESLQALVRASAARTPGVVWLESGWALADDEQRVALAEALDVTVAPAEVLRARAWRLLLEQLVEPVEVAAPTTTVAPAPTTTAAPVAAPTTGGATATTVAPTTVAPTTTAPPPEAIDAASVLAGAGLLTVEASGDDQPALAELLHQGAIVLLVTAPAGDLEGTGAVESIVGVGPEVGVPTVLVSASPDGEAAAVLRMVREDDGLAARIPTVDNAHLPEGRAAAVLAAADLVRSLVGHYGDLDGADRVVPAWSASPVEPG